LAMTAAPETIQAGVSISAACRRGILNHATAGIVPARGGAGSNAKADESEDNGRKN